MKKYFILFETNLTRFKLHKVNRPTDDNQSKNLISEISETMKKSGFRQTEPIIVTRPDKNGNIWVIDGQHRLLAAMSCGIGVYFVTDENVNPNSQKSIFDAFREYNKCKKKIMKNDYVHGFATMGNENFQTLQEFSKKFPMFSLTEQMMFLQNSGTKHPSKKNFQDGKFDVANVKKAETWASNLLELKPYFEKGYNRSVFVRTILTIMEKKKDFKFDEFLHKVKLRPGSIHLCGDKNTYATMIENIYNYRRRDDEKLNLRF